ncbi:sialate O-acetylesterase [Parachryseolinea silvisoli]|uniref:sialate O-acetylesterase n=1 Tax=Parachryseolinea silvisoli TaxID=2873601 RepID=UPI002265A721|nr:sialate O-acetylesterase [Parachryseolinea silvisoli]MCD9017659.1 beta galactosidase jelly roll domain-containing protein [Parachryseolinea silvisoli]
MKRTRSIVMPFRILVVLCSMIALLAVDLTVKAGVKLPAIFRDHMVLQRNAPLKVWGWASPGEKVRATLAMQSATAVADKLGKWSLALPAMEAGGPFELRVEGKNAILLSDVLIGDVWICGGQSNMQWNIDQTGFQEQDSTFLKHGQVRLFTVHVDIDYLPAEDIKGGTGWNKLTQENIKYFSAVAYHFGKKLYQELNVPIGLISDNLGATSIESWMSNEALLSFEQFRADLAPVLKRNKNFAAMRADFEKMKPAWYKKYYYKGPGLAEEWFRVDTDLSEWKPIDAIGNTWEAVPDLRDHDGAVWFRTTFDLPANYTGKTFHVGLLQVDDYDIAWVNGMKVGENYGNYNHHGYDVPVDILKPTGNVLVVRVFDVGGIGGFTTAAMWAHNILQGDWLYRKGQAIDAAKFPKVLVPNATPFSSPAVLYNGSIAPLTNLAIKGVIWYQGEANADRAYEYRTLFPTMINDWRSKWKQPNLPFLFVQLANYMGESPLPVPSAWAELREAQASVLTMANTAMAVAIDIGEGNDIHPKNKEDVGKRLALGALSNVYSKDIVSAGPTFRSMKVSGSKAVMEYDHTGGGLMTKDKYGFVRGFQMAGEDRKFYWAQGIIVNGKVEVTSSNVTNPVAVRYAWDNNPGQLDLCNAEGLPAVPFRTDDWEGITVHNKFQTGQPRF